ncbi:carbohydrate kinase family protein [Janthinobacterium sp. B9-8]|uniref:carbohydrate kinase family protein n=1 Tax=Janthinobacterium sp. B9-8 TaxID=1236179 RepID=UPI00061CE128|nr:carbohydrate kinase [Janthinobacterium sp. B9-8]AMC33470.1 sugar kinase [Janthinobacterium sp. B9-8]
MPSSTPDTFPTFIAAGEALTDMIRLDGENWASKVGGSTWNVARVLASFGLPSAFAGAISKDCFGEDLYQASLAAGLDLRFLQQLDKSPLMAIVPSAKPPQYFFVGNDSADLYFDPQTLPSGWQSNVRWVHFGGISLARQPLATKLVTLAKNLKAQGVKISYDPNHRILMDEQYDATFRTMSELADVIKVSDEDLVGLFRSNDLDQAFTTLRSWNPQAHILYTRGADGASLFTPNDIVTADAIQVQVADSVGAGDASIGGLIYSLMSWPERETREHLFFAIASGAAACMHHGATPPSLDTINSLYTR